MKLLLSFFLLAFWANALAIDFSFPKINFTVEYNEQSAFEGGEEVAKSKPVLPPSPSPKQEEVEAEAEAEEEAIGTLNGRELANIYEITPPNLLAVDLSKELLAQLEEITLSSPSPSPPPPPPVARNMAPLSPTILKAIGREIAKTPTKVRKPSPSKSGSTAPVALRAYSADTNGEDISFQFVPHYNRLESIASDEDGTVSIQRTKIRPGILRGSLMAQGKMTTVVDIPTGPKGRIFEVPLMEEYRLYSLVDKFSKETSSEGSLLAMVREGVEDIQLSSSYATRIFLNQELQEVSKEQDYFYILFVGVRPGNTTLSYLLADGEVAERIVHLSSNELLYDFGHIVADRYEQLELYQRNLFASRAVSLALSQSDIFYFNGRESSVSKGLNRYEIKRPPFVEGDRSYIRLNDFNNGGTIYAGYQGREKKLELPASDFIDHILDGFELNQLDNDCIVQLNFPLFPINASIRLNSAQAEASMSTIYLSADGTFHQSPTVSTTKAFLWGEEMGIFSAQIEYSDNSTAFLNSFCSPGSYLVEEL